MTRKSNTATPQPVAHRLSTVKPSIMAGLVTRARELREGGREIIDLGAGVPDYDAPEFLIKLGAEALRIGPNSYGDARGSQALRAAIAKRYAATQHLDFNPNTEVTITGGASAALNAALLALVNPGDGVVVFDPYFEFFLPQIKLAGGNAKFVSLKAPTWTFTDTQLRRAFSGRTRFMLLNTPHNPTGRVFTREELERIAHWCVKQDVIVISDETYEPFVYDCKHVSIASLPGMRDRTITIASVSKVFNVAGWRIGSVVAAPHLTNAIRLVNGLASGAPVPLQEACAIAMPQYQSFVNDLLAAHQPLRDQLTNALWCFGAQPYKPQGTLSVFADCTKLGFKTDLEVCEFMLNDLGILAAPGSAFFSKAPTGQEYLRFSFARKAETIAAAVAKLPENRTCCKRKG